MQRRHVAPEEPSSLGQNQFLTALLMKYFPTFKTNFIPGMAALPVHMGQLKSVCRLRCDDGLSLGFADAVRSLRLAGHVVFS